MLARITEAMVRVECQRAFRRLHPEEHPDANDVSALHIPEYQPNTLTASFRVGGFSACCCNQQSE